MAPGPSVSAVVADFITEGHFERHIRKMRVAALNISQRQASKHLGVLKRARLLDVEPRAQQRLYGLRPERFRDLNEWLERHRALWDERMGQLDELVAEMSEQKPPFDSPRQGRVAQEPSKKEVRNGAIQSDHMEMRVETQIRGCSLYRSDRPGLRTHGARLRCSTAVSRACVHPRGRPRAALLAAAIFAAACGGGQLTAPLPLPTPGNATPASIAESVTDGDTIRFSPPQLGSSSVRYLDIDAPELGGATQEPWAARSRDNLRALLAPGTPITITLDQQAVDSFGRVLGHVRRASDGLNTNREQVRAGHAVLYVIWPNVAGFLDYRGAQIEAQDAGAGVWSPAQPLRELPFEYRARIDGRPLFRPVGDYFTRRYVDPASHTLVHVNNRVFFGSDAEARTAGYEPCPRGAENRYSAACFAPGR